MPCGCEKSSWQIPTASGSLAAPARPHKEVSALWVEFRCSVDCSEEADRLQWKLTQTLASCAANLFPRCQWRRNGHVLLNCDSVSGAWAIEHSLSHCQLRGVYKLNFVFQYLCFGLLLLHINEMGCKCAVWVESASLVVALVGKACILQSYASIYVLLCNLIVLLRLDIQTRREFW